MAILEKLDSGLSVILTKMLVPILILNILGGLISSIWLAVLGEWTLIFVGIIFMAVSDLLIFFILAPSFLLFDAPTTKAIEKNKKSLGRFLTSLSVVYTLVLITTWGLFVMRFFTKLANGSLFTPALIWSYIIAIAPWIVSTIKLQSKFGGNENFMLSFAQFFYIITIVMFFLRINLITIAITLGIIILTSVTLLLIPKTLKIRESAQFR